MWLTYVLLGVYVFICLVLITAVLLQPGKSDAAALFGGGASQTAFGPRGTMNILGWTTWIAAGLMIVLALIFSLPQMFGPPSVLQSGESTAPIEQPVEPAESGANGSQQKPPAAPSTGTDSETGSQQPPPDPQTKP